MDRAAFDRTVAEAVAALAPQIRDALKDVVIVVEQEPRMHAGSRSLLLGLYEGVPLTEWGRDYSGRLPDRITLYQGSIERAARSEGEIAHLIRETLWHEIAHFFGYDHDFIAKMERRWRSKRGRGSDMRITSENA